MKSRRKHNLVHNENIELKLSNILEMKLTKTDEQGKHFEFLPYKKLVETKSAFESV